MSILTQPNDDSATLPEYTTSILDCSGDVLCPELGPGHEKATAVNEAEHNAASYVLDTDTAETPSENSESRADVFSTGKHLATKEAKLENSSRSNSFEDGIVDTTDTEAFRDKYDPKDTERIPLISVNNGQGSSQEGGSEREYSVGSQGGGCGEVEEQPAVEDEWLNGTRSPSSLMAYSKASSGRSSVWSDEDVSNGTCSPQYELMKDSSDESIGADSDCSSPGGTPVPSGLRVVKLHPSLEQCELNPHPTGMEQTSSNGYAHSASVSDGDKTSVVNIQQQQLSPVQPSLTSPLSPITTPAISPTAPAVPPPSPPQRTEQTDGDTSTVSHAQGISAMHGVNLSHFPVIDIQTNTSGDNAKQCVEENKDEMVEIEEREEEEELGEEKEEVNVATSKERERKNVNGGEGGTERCDREERANGGGGGGGGGEKVADSQNKCDSPAGERGHGGAGGDGGDGDGGEGDGGGGEGDSGEVDGGGGGGDGGDSGGGGGGGRGGECLEEGARENSELTYTASPTSPTHTDPSDIIREVYTEPPTPLMQSSDETVSRIENTPPPSSPLEGENVAQGTALLPAVGVSTDTETPTASNQPLVTTTDDDFMMDLLLESNLDSSNLDSGVRVPSSDLPVLQPLSPNPDLNEQYEYLRRTLSHSRRRYSTRRRRGHGGAHSPVRRGNRAERRAQQHTVGHLRDMLHNDEAIRGTVWIVLLL